MEPITSPMNVVPVRSAFVTCPGLCDSALNRPLLQTLRLTPRIGRSLGSRYCSNLFSQFNQSIDFCVICKRLGAEKMKENFESQNFHHPGFENTEICILPVTYNTLWFEFFNYLIFFFRIFGSKESERDNIVNKMWYICKQRYHAYKCLSS